MTTIPMGARGFPAIGPLDHDVTLDPEGTADVTLAWAGVDDDGLIRSSSSDQHTFDNLPRVPRISPSFQARERGGAIRGVGSGRQAGDGAQDPDGA